MRYHGKLRKSENDIKVKYGVRKGSTTENHEIMLIIIMLNFTIIRIIP